MKWLILMCAITLTAAAQAPAKRCAFDLKYVATTRPAKVKPSVVQQFRAELYADQLVMIAPVIVTRLSCPYEHAVEVFGEDRVEYHETVKQRQVVVDGEVVYEEDKP